LVAFVNDLSPFGQLLLRIVFVTSALSLVDGRGFVGAARTAPQWAARADAGDVSSTSARCSACRCFSGWSLCTVAPRGDRSSVLAFVSALTLVDRSALWPELASRLDAAAPCAEYVRLVQATALALFVLVLRAWNRAAACRRQQRRSPRTPRRCRCFTSRHAGSQSPRSPPVTVWLWTRPAARVSSIFVDRSNDTALQVAADGEGLLLTGGNLHLLQLRTRRPVLLDGGGLDGIAYSIAAAPEMERILRDIYGVDYFHPPEEARRSGAVPAGFSQKVWEARSSEEWMALTQRYGVTDIITPSDWSLALPVAAQSRDFRLYRIVR
jgi:hypothetical protein